MVRIRATLMIVFLLGSLACYAQQGSIGGTVLDISGDAVPAARVTLVALDRANSEMALSDQEGRFSFTSLPPGRFMFTVSSMGKETYSSPEMVLHAGENLSAPEFRLPMLMTASTVQVMVTPSEIAEQQV